MVFTFQQGLLLSRSIMSSLIPGLSWFSRSSEKERSDANHTRSGKGRRRTLSEPIPMDVDWEEGSRSKCLVCNGMYTFFIESVHVHWLPKDAIARSYPDTTPILFYDRGKPFFECVETIVAIGCDPSDFLHMQVHKLLASLGRVRWKDLPHCGTPCVWFHTLFP